MKLVELKIRGWEFVSKVFLETMGWNWGQSSDIL
jgi:hypothetical protein